MNVKVIVMAATLIVVVIFGTILFSGCTGKNDFATYQIKQSLGGEVVVIDEPGIYNKAFATIYTYSRSVQAFYSEDAKEGNKEDESIGVHFNDGGTAKISVMVQFQLPTEQEKRKHLHQTFGNIEAVKQAVRAHLINCVKNTGPMMSATENQAARKGEFNQVVEEQLRKGIYAMRRVEIELKDKATPTAATQPSGNIIQSLAPVKVWATEIVNDSKTGSPIIVEKSPLEEYGIVIQQFSITGTHYDDATQQQFAAKQASYLAAEKSKAQREAEVQQTLMVEQKGLREKAEAEAIENVKKVQQVIAAKSKAEVAEQEKKQAETVAEQQLSVAKLTKESAEMKASQEAAVLQTAAEQKVKQATQEAQAAQIEAEQRVKVSEAAAREADNKAKAIIALAEAEQKKIQLAGALSEKDKMTLEIESKTRIGVAEAISKVQVPSTVINGNGTGDGKSITDSLLNISLLRSLGIVPEGRNQPPIRAATTSGN